VFAEFKEADDRDQRDRLTDEQITALLRQVESERVTALRAEPERLASVRLR
jgi:hypothetical protein